MSLNADKSAPIAVSVDERKRIWALPEVEALLDEQTKVCACNITRKHLLYVIQGETNMHCQTWIDGVR